MDWIKKAARLSKVDRARNWYNGRNWVTFEIQLLRYGNVDGMWDEIL